jgi:NADPH-dependent 2,4-dienoyl-CoA reductase/sulfur reductase-like enzyme/nitrite reductase/ring-hydroxylating ferredoxin subunit
MSDQAKPDGPDLIKGVSSVDVAEGQMLAGRVGDEAVLIARTGGALYAVSALCTHYQGPLADGLIKDGVVRCPWHHACFSLKTGEAVGAPAIDPLACYAVEEADGRIVVKAKQETAPKQMTAPDEIKKVVIIGGGAAGFAAAEMLRRRGYSGALTMLSADADAPYDRPNCSKDYLAGDAEEAWMPLRDRDFYKDNKIDLRLETEVLAFDPKAKTVTLPGAKTLSYDALILATGAQPQRPPIPGLEGPNVHVLRSLKDTQALIAAAKTAQTVAVIGASFIGLEVAAALRARNLAVHVIAPEEIPFEKILGREIGEWVRSEHAKNGVVFHLGRKVTAYKDGALTLDQGDPVKTDLVVLGVGVKPRTGLAEAAGLKVDKGVVVDERLCAADGVYAVGDIARYPDPVSGDLIRVEHWVHAERQGQHVARMILGEDAPFTDVPFFWSKHYGAAIHYDGHAENFDTPKVDGSVADYDALVRYEKGGQLLAVATLNRDLASLKAEAAFEESAGR